MYSLTVQRYSIIPYYISRMFLFPALCIHLRLYKTQWSFRIPTWPNSEISYEGKQYRYIPHKPLFISSNHLESRADIRVASSPISLHSASRSFLTPGTLIRPHSELHVAGTFSSETSSSTSRLMRVRRCMEYGSWLNRDGAWSGVGAKCQLEG
jgi:hypothetical protein